MRDILPQLRRWWAGDQPVAVATVVGHRGSAPLPEGSALALSASGEVVGSVSGGCVEAAVVEEAQTVLTTGRSRLVSYGISDEQAFSVGLTCGGEIDVLLGCVDRSRWPGFPEVAEAVEAGVPVAVCTVVAGSADIGSRLAVWLDRTASTLGDPGLDHAVTRDARGMLRQGRTGQLHYGPSGQQRQEEVAVFVQSFAPPPRMLVFGATDFAAAMVRVGKLLGYRVSVCDARAAFATRERFPQADDIVVEWPHRYLERTTTDERSVLCVLTHDPKFDVPLLEVALRKPARYIGAMGSRRTHEERLQSLVEAGLTSTELARLRSPVGLDLGGRTPEETAVSIAAEIILDQWGGSGRPLRHTSGPIHADADDARS